MKKRYTMKKTISMKRFIIQLGDNFSDHVKNKLLNLEVRCVLTRQEDNYRFDILHVEHLKYDDKEYSYGRLIVLDGKLYFSNKCTENDQITQAPIVENIYNSLDNDGMITDKGIDAKEINDSNVDYIIDTMLTVFPQVSQSYLDIMQHITLEVK